MISDCVKEHQFNRIRVHKQYDDIQDIKDNPERDVEYRVIFGQVYTGRKPMMMDLKLNSRYPYFPHEARIRNMTYQIDSKVDVHIEKSYRDRKDELIVEKYEQQQIELCKIPVMIRSSQCHLSDENDKGILRQKECMYD